MYKWVVATDAETGAEVVSAPSARARTFVPTEPTPAQLKAHQAAMAPSAAVAGGGRRGVARGASGEEAAAIAAREEGDGAAGGRA